MIAYTFITYEIQNRVAILTLNRPEKLNALNTPILHEIHAAIDEAEVDDAVGVVLIRGAGRAFSAGADLNEIGPLKNAAQRRYVRLDYANKNRIASCQKPVVAAIHGYAFGGGMEMALSCDVRLVADNALFALPEITLGSIPGSSGLQRLPQVVGLGIAKEWALMGRRIDAQEAHLRGLANHVYPLDQLMPQALEFCQKLANNSPLALSLAKVALCPAPPPTDGLEGVYHTLASQACHSDPAYEKRTTRFQDKKS